MNTTLTELDKVKHAIKMAGGEYHNPYPWRHNAVFNNGVVITFRDHIKKPDRIMFNAPSKKISSCRNDVSVGSLTRQIRNYSIKC